MKPLLKAALLFGIVPLVVGIAIFVAWVLTRADRLMYAGMIMICVGFCSVVIGFICLVIYLMRSWRSRTVPRRRLVWQAMAILILFLANFVAAGAAVWGALAIQSCYTVSVINQGTESLEAVHVEGGGVKINFGTIAPRTAVKRSFWVKGDGKLTLKGTQGAREIEATIDGYVTSLSGGNKIVVVDPKGTVDVWDRYPKKPD